MKIIDRLAAYERTRAGVINLVASENILCLAAKAPYLSDIISRYSFDPTSGDFYFPGRKALDDIENQCRVLVGDLLNAKHVNVKPISGLNCMLAIIGALTKPSDVIYSMAPDKGGHGATKPLALRLGLTHKFLPFSMDSMDFDFEALEAMLREEENVKIVYLDFMNLLFPVSMEKLKEALPKNTILVFDASHVMGLILGRAFPNPLDEGADILIGSTHKTLPGPHKGVIATNRAIFAKMFDHYWPLFISHHHMADVAALGIALETLGEQIVPFAEGVVANAQTLALRLFEGGIRTLGREPNFTATHQIWLDLGGKENVVDFATRLADLGVIANALAIPALNNEWGLRIGVQEVSYLGYREQDMNELADIILAVFHDTSSKADLKQRVEKLSVRKQGAYSDLGSEGFIQFMDAIN